MSQLSLLILGAAVVFALAMVGLALKRPKPPTAPPAAAPAYPAPLPQPTTPSAPQLPPGSDWVLQSQTIGSATAGQDVANRFAGAFRDQSLKLIAESVQSLLPSPPAPKNP